jgi:hypothetical protein
VIWLEPGCVDEAGEDRHWCQDDAWGACEECGRKPVKYVIASEVERLTSSLAAASARVVELEKVLREARDHIRLNHKATAWHNDPAAWHIIKNIIDPALSQIEEGR